MVTVSVVLLGACRAGNVDRDALEPEDRPAIGVILVGQRDDLGYNQAVWEASDAVAREHPDLRLLRVEDVPETDAAVDAMEALIDDGAELIFATSFGHLDAARTIAEAHPDVVVVHQGGREGDDLDNFGTYWGDHHEVMYAAGIAAISDSASGDLGFVAAFPIPSTYANIDAFALGARSVRPDATVHVAFTDDWCDETAQRRAYDEVRAHGADVIGMHQDCTRALLEWAERDGIGIVGFHADGSEVAPSSWLTGAVWDWRDTYLGIVDAWQEDRFANSEYGGDFRGSLVDDTTPAVLAEPGPRVDDDTREQMMRVLGDFRRGASTAFSGPITDVDGTQRVAEGETLSVEEVDALDWFVDGVHVDS